MWIRMTTIDFLTEEDNLVGHELRQKKNTGNWEMLTVWETASLGTSLLASYAIPSAQPWDFIC